MNINAEVSQLRKELAQAGDPGRAEGEKKYLKSPMLHYGVTVPQIRAIANRWLKANHDLSLEELIGLTCGLWVGKYHEERILAINLLEANRHKLCLHHLPMVESMVRTATGWAQLDEIAAWLVGALYEKDPSAIAQVFRSWAEDPNLWVRRAALLGQLKPLREGRGDFGLFTELSVPLLPEKEFFIRKAIGWVLRERAKKVPTDTFDYVQKYGTQMSGLSLREATRKLRSITR